MIIFIYIYLLLGIITSYFGFFFFLCIFRIFIWVIFFLSSVKGINRFYDRKIQPAKANGTGLAKSNTLLLTNKTLLGSNSSRSVFSIGNVRKRNFSSSAPVSGKRKRGAVESVDSSYNGSDPELLYYSSDKIQEKAVSAGITRNKLESAREIASKYEENPETLTTDERVELEAAKRHILNYDNDKSLTDNINQEINKRSEVISGLEEKYMAKQDKANDILSDEPVKPTKYAKLDKANTQLSDDTVDPVKPKAPTDNLTPTQNAKQDTADSVDPVKPKAPDNLSPTQNAKQDTADSADPVKPKAPDNLTWTEYVHEKESLDPMNYIFDDDG